MKHGLVVVLSHISMFIPGEPWTVNKLALVGLRCAIVGFNLDKGLPNPCDRIYPSWSGSARTLSRLLECYLVAKHGQSLPCSTSLQGQVHRPTGPDDDTS